MGDDTTTFYKSLFTGQVEKVEQTKKAASRMRKATGAGPSAKRAKKTIPPSRSEILEEASEEPEVAAIPPPEVAADVPPTDVSPQSPTSSQALLDAMVEVPSAEERHKRKGKGISTEEASDSGDDVVEVPPGSLSQAKCDVFSF